MIDNVVNRIPWMALVGLAILPVFRIVNLTWLEVFRLLFITLGLFLLYRKLKKDTDESQSERSSPFIEKHVPKVLALVYLFILIQFDPATSAFHDLFDRSRINWFFCISSGLVCLAGLPIARQGLRRNRKRGAKGKRSTLNLTTSDKIVSIAGAAAILLSFFSKLVLGTEGTKWADSLWYVKVGECCIPWFLITRYVSPSSAQGAASEVSVRTQPRVATLLMKPVCVTFTIVILGGIGRSALAVYHFNKGNWYFSRSEIEGAKKRYKQVFKMNRTLGYESLQNKGLQKLASAYLKSDSIAQAEHIIENMGGQDALKKIGNIYFDAEEWREARLHYQRFVQSGESDPQIFDKLALCHIKLKDVYELSRFVSEHNYKFRIDFDDSESLIVLGRYYLGEGQYDAAIQVFEKVKESILWREYYLGRAFQGLNQYAKAEEYFRKAIEIEPGFADAYYRLGTCVENEGALDTAREFYEKTIDLLPNHLDGLRALLRMHKLTGEE